MCKTSGLNYSSGDFFWGSHIYYYGCFALVQPILQFQHCDVGGSKWLALTDYRVGMR